MELRTYDSFEEMHADLAQAEAEANGRVLPEQAAIADGTYWFRVVDEGGPIAIFGKVADEAEYRKGLEGYDEEEIQADLAHHRESRERGYVYGPCYSIICPGGEWGSTHVSEIWPLSADRMALAKAAGWTIEGCMPWIVEVIRHWAQIAHEAEARRG